MPFLSVKKLCGGYGDLQILRDIDLEIETGEIVALLGANGAGKTTLMRTLAGLNRAKSGSIWLNGHDLTHVACDQIVQAGLSLAPEGRRLFAGMTVSENLEMGAFCNRRDLAGRRQKIFSILPKLYERRNHLAGDLSGGEQQMTAIGRSLMSDPKLLLIDEFSLGLAPTIVASLTEVLQAIYRQGVSILIVEQDVRMVLEISQRAYVMETGAIVLSGKSSELLHNPKIQEAYLGM